MQLHPSAMCTIITYEEIEKEKTVLEITHTHEKPALHQNENEKIAQSDFIYTHETWRDIVNVVRLP